MPKENLRRPLRIGFQVAPALLFLVGLGNLACWAAQSITEIRNVASLSFDGGSLTSNEVVITNVHSLIAIATASAQVRASGSDVSLAGSYVDNAAHGIASWAWNDGGAGGAFTPSASVRNPTYTMPANTSGATRTVTLTVTAICDGPVPLQDTANVQVLVTYDYDMEGMPDEWERAHGFNLEDPADAALDADGDGLSSLEEYRHDTDPHKADTDGDRFTDGEEVRFGSNPLDPNSRPVGTFADVPSSHWAWRLIEAIYGARITAGCEVNPRRYCPTATVTRSQMAVFLCKAAGKGPLMPSAPRFEDVPETYWAYGFIERLADSASWPQAIAPTLGCWVSEEERKYCPELPVTRGQMATFLVRAASLAPGADHHPGSYYFTDVSPYFPHDNNIGTLYETHVTAGIGPRLFGPSLSVTRDQMAVFLVKSFLLPKM